MRLLERPSGRWGVARQAVAAVAVLVLLFQILLPGLATAATAADGSEAWRFPIVCGDAADQHAPDTGDKDLSGPHCPACPTAGGAGLLFIPGQAVALPPPGPGGQVPPSGLSTIRDSRLPNGSLKARAPPAV